ncbi:twin-arginine translocation signal domain-containing protein [uncultured Microbacterium sp.]|uniref:twin-arginine translocation signal domain-containing protein n=1 Tax=uncultured Microbacterium sp. TaxID=191216 RepID=UPI000959E2D1|nr:twin-arginine translocation signal domain-containing protein [uncultured Microbacterium sp.]MBN9141097.1 twin-arginine translocation signal domain-containing protein [Micrococcales bacterium]OJX69712.1 MAG: hypothetical protein BGO94_14665 [Micrococcales bacterium 72-143]
MSRRGFIGLGSALGALVVVAIVLLVIVLVRMDRDRRQAEHERRVAICKEGLADPFGRDLDALLACIERLEG